VAEKDSLTYAKDRALVTSLKPSTHAMPQLSLPNQRIKAPQFPRTFAWVNTDRPLCLREELKGNVVVLDFWTYCCINCMHVIPDLEFLEEKYADSPVTIIGVHSAKFENESDRENVRTACRRYHIAHPVIVDEAHRIWSEYGVSAWPTLVIIDSDGRIVGSLSGEGNRDLLDSAIAALLEEGRAKGTLADSPPRFQHDGRVPSASGLAFPGKVLAEPRGRLVFVSDSNHDRIIIADREGQVLAIAGSGNKGIADGTFTQAEFNNPQGLAYDDKTNTLYVADTDNHLIRRLDLNKSAVETVCGTGSQVYDRTGGRPGRKQGLNSPWDLCLADGRLFIAMAGNHQLWVFDPSSQIAEAWIGSGRENIRDGIGLQCELAQPSGLTRSGDWLYFVDSEVSAVRRVHLQTREVQTLVGSGLFDFGDRDGVLSGALLQHPLGIAAANGDVFVADTYNHKIKRIRESREEITSILGGKSGDHRAGNDLQLHEPGGLSARGDTLYIADTNNDRIIEYDISSGTWREFILHGLFGKQAVQMDITGLQTITIRVKPESDVIIRMTAQFPAELQWNREAPIHWMIAQAGPATPDVMEGRTDTMPAEITMPSSVLIPDAEYIIALNFAYCTNENSSLCVPYTLRWRLIFEENPDGENICEFTAPVIPIITKH